MSLPITVAPVEGSPTTPASDQLKRLQVDFRNVAFQVANKKGVKRVIVQNQNGSMLPGQLFAIMGSSGAGKTTLLNILAGRLHKGVSGEIYVNGHPKDSEEFAKDFAYVTQDDIMLDTLTPREMLRFSAKLQLPELTESQQFDRVEQILAELKILKCADTIVGTPGLVQGLSGGERKRLNIALSLVKAPSVIFLDEPTSGLDASSALSLVRSLKDLASRGRTIVTTIHQPSSSIFDLFDKLYLMCAGEVVYNGPAKQAVPYFASVGYPCPAFSNPADHLMDIIQSDEDIPHQQDSGKSEENPSPINVALAIPLEDSLRPDVSKVQAISDQGSKSERARYFTESFKTTQAWTNSTTPIAVDTAHKKAALGSISHASIQRWFSDFGVLTQRAVKCAIRDKFALRARFAQTIGMSIIGGLLYLHVSHYQDGIRDRQGALFFCAIAMLMSSVMSVLFVFPKERPVFLREFMDGMYSPSSYFMSKMMTDLPYGVLPCAVFCCIAYFMVGFQLDPAKFFIFYVTTLLMALNGSGVGLFVSSAVSSVEVALSVAPGIFMPILLFGGFFVKLENIPVFIRWIQWLSPVKYALESFFINELTGNTFECKSSELAGPPGAQICPIVTGQRALEFYGYDGVPQWRPLVLLVVLAVFFRIVAFVTLRRAAFKTKNA